MDKDVLSVFKEIDKINPFATFLEESTLSNVDTWYDTGCMPLNAVISGSLYGGVPQGRIVGFSGDSGCGKTLITLKTMVNAEKNGVYPIVFDSENAVDKKTYRNLGGDPNKLKHVPVITIEETRNQMCAILDKVIETETFGKFIFCIDSIGNLLSTKELTDAEKNKDAADMGTRAKALKAMFKLITHKAALAKCTILFTNHVYDDPAALFTSLVKNQSGGKGPVYLSSVLVQIGHKKVDDSNEDKDEELAGGSKKYKGMEMRFLTVKNRFVPPFKLGEAYLSYATGLKKYAGLLELSKDLGVITGDGKKGFTVHPANGEDIYLGKYGVWKDDEHKWSQVLPHLEEELGKVFKFSSAEEADRVNDEIEENTVYEE